MIDKELDELIVLLENNPNIKKLEDIKSKIDDDLLKLIDDYRVFPTVEKKKKIYDNPLYKEYIACESELNYLIMEINNKFKRGKICESNKW